MSDLAMPLAAAVVFFAYLVRGVTGFGSALVAVPLLVHLLPLTVVVPFITVLDVLAALLLTNAGQRRGHVQWGEVRWLLPGSLIGVVVGLQLLVQLDRDLLLGMLGLLVIGFGLRQVLDMHGDRIIARAWAVPAGMIGGAISAVFAAGGPPFVIYLSHRLRDKGTLRATLSAVFLIDGTLRVIGLLLTGLLLQPDMGWYLLAGLPLMAAGIRVGNRVHLGIDRRQMALAVGLLLVGSGAALWLRLLLGR